MKLTHDYLDPNGFRETVAGLTVPLRYVPIILSALLSMSAILLLGFAAAFNLARQQVGQLTEEFGWPLLYSERGIIGSATYASGILLALLSLAVPALALWRAWVLAEESLTREFSLWLLGGSIIAFALAIVLTSSLSPGFARASNYGMPHKRLTGLYASRITR